MTQTPANDNGEIERARAALRQIPLTRDAADAASITRLGGLTNLVFAATTHAGDFCLRLPGAGTEAYIDRAAEAANARAAANAGVSPEIVHFGADGIMLTQLIAGAVTMSPAAFRERPGAVERAAQAFRQLHDEAPAFASRFDLFHKIDEYRALLRGLGTSLPEGYDDLVVAADKVREALDARPDALKPCHCDPLCENFLDAPGRMWIVDWEYSGQNDPMWDLGDLSVEAGFDAEMERRMMEAYFGRPATQAEFGRMAIYKAMCDLLWTLWGLIQHGNGNPADDFWAYAVNRFERCKRLMRSPEFAKYLAHVRHG
jgi:thiamine kinase-like enzyme